MATMTHRKFLSAAKKEFGNKVSVGIPKVNKEATERTGITNTALRKYGSQAWVTSNEKGEIRCPKCNAELLGFFGAFTWGIAHGYGFCGHCKKIEFQYYHYLKEKVPPLQVLAISAF